MIIIVAMPMTPAMSQDQDHMARSARAQRRAIIEPTPSQMSTTASDPYRSPTGTKLTLDGGGGLALCSAIVIPNINSGTRSAQKHPIKTVRTPKITKPTFRSLVGNGGGRVFESMTNDITH